VQAQESFPSFPPSTTSKAKRGSAPLDAGATKKAKTTASASAATDDVPTTILAALRWVELTRQGKLAGASQEKSATAYLFQASWMLKKANSEHRIPAVFDDLGNPVPAPNKSTGKAKRLDPSTRALNVLRDLLSHGDTKDQKRHLNTLSANTLACTLAELGGLALYVQNVDNAPVVYSKNSLVTALVTLLKQVTRLGIDRFAS
jgi:hypothetical protein